MVVQIFKGDQLVETRTVSDQSDRIVARAPLKASKGVQGVYVCQAMSEDWNVVFRKSFTISGRIGWSAARLVYLFFCRYSSVTPQTLTFVLIFFTLVMMS